MNEIVEIFPYSSRTQSIWIHNDEVAKRAEPGNFLMVRFAEDGARLPFSIVSTDPERELVEIIIHRADGLDDIQPLLKPGRQLPDLLGPLGKAAKVDSNRKVLCCGDGAGFVPLLPILKALHKQGCQVWSVMSERSDKTACLSEEIENHSDKVVLASEDNLNEIVERTIVENGIEKVWMAGPAMLMQELTDICRAHNVKADCILNMIMIDGIGLCGVCRVTIAGERRQTCTDGPVFNALDVDFQQLINRQRLFDS